MARLRSRWLPFRYRLTFEHRTLAYQNAPAISAARALCE